MEKEKIKSFFINHKGEFSPLEVSKKLPAIKYDTVRRMMCHLYEQHFLERHNGKYSIYIPKVDRNSLRRWTNDN